MHDTIRLNAGPCPVRFDAGPHEIVSPFLEWSRLLAGRRAPTIRAWVRSGIVPVRVADGEVRLSFEESIASRAAALGLRIRFATRANAGHIYRTAMEGLRRLGGGFPGAALVVPEPAAPPLVLFGSEDTISDVLRATWPGAFTFRLSRRFRDLQDWFDPAAECRRPAASVIDFAGVTR